MPKAARAAMVVALFIAAISGLSIRSGPIMLLGVCFAALLAAIGIYQRRAWSAYGFAFLLALSMLAMIFFATTGQYAGSFIQIIVSLILYGGIAGLFIIAGHMLTRAGGKRGTPIPWILIALLLAGPFVLFRPVNVSSSGMQDTLLIGDSLLVNRSIKTPPTSGDIVAFHFPRDRQQILVRRIAGVAGDRIHMVSGNLYRNGEAVHEPYVTQRKLALVEDSAGLTDITVPANKFFVLGDFRDNSRDSRQWGFIDRSDIIGRPKYIYDSLAPDPADIKPADANSGENDSVNPVHPPLRRWDRIFKAF